MAGIAGAGCNALHVDVVVHRNAHDQGLTTEVVVFARTASGELRTLGRAFGPHVHSGSSAPSGGVQTTLRLQYDAWEGQLLIGLGAIALPLLQVSDGSCGVFLPARAVIRHTHTLTSTHTSVPAFNILSSTVVGCVFRCRR